MDGCEVKAPSNIPPSVAAEGMNWLRGSFPFHHPRRLSQVTDLGKVLWQKLTTVIPYFCAWDGLYICVWKPNIHMLHSVCKRQLPLLFLHRVMSHFWSPCHGRWTPPAAHLCPVPGSQCADISTEAPPMTCCCLGTDAEKRGSQNSFTEVSCPGAARCVEGDGVLARLHLSEDNYSASWPCGVALVPIYYFLSLVLWSQVLLGTSQTVFLFFRTVRLAALQNTLIDLHYRLHS